MLAGAPNAAEYLFREMTFRGVEPQVTTFCHIVGAYSGKPIEQLTPWLEQLKTHNLQPTSVFLEYYICSLFGRRVKEQLHIGSIGQAKEVPVQLSGCS